MRKVSAALSGCAIALLSLNATAASLRVQVLDQSGKPAADTVIYAMPASGKPPAGRPADAIIDQIHRQFVPLVSIIQTGASIDFPNQDDIAHDVYSFSPAKKFEIKLYHGVPHRVLFDKPGLVVMGCNVHDWMIAYLMVVDTPYFAKTDASGQARLPGLPAGGYQVTAWNYRAPDQDARPTQNVDLDADASVKFVLQLNPLKPESP
jgi:hypothetical protein